METEKLHVWERKYADSVALVTVFNQLYGKITSDKETTLQIPYGLENLPCKEQENWILAQARYPHVYARGNKCEIEFTKKIQERKSAIDQKISIDMEHWCVTLFNADMSNIWQACLPCAWMGHALLVVETIEEGNDFARQIDLVKNEQGKAHVRLFELSQKMVERCKKDYAKTNTYRRPKEDIQKMIDTTYKDICRQKAGNPSVIFAFDSGKMVEGLSRLTLARREWCTLTELAQQRIRMDRRALAQASNTEVYNCIGYAISKCNQAKITEPFTSKYLLSATFWPTPVLYTRSKLAKLKALMQEASFVSTYSAFCSIVPAALGLLTAGSFGASVGAGIGVGWGLSDAYSAYKISPEQEQNAVTQQEGATS